MTDKTPIGIPELDDALGGGIPRGYVILLEVDTGTRSDAFVTNFLTTGLNNEELAYILCTETPLGYFHQQLRERGIDVDAALEQNRLVGIDAFTDAFGWGEFKVESKYSVHDLTNSRQVHDILRKVVLEMKSTGNLRGVVDSLTSILHAADQMEAAISYVHHQISAQKKHGNILLY
ncbi:MAG: RAD55 family ATPase, partial [Candidatus Hermodarchaeota archaeon]|nr:RAD55 family ATPase [Candidatus Hermodarchaeota archaeon]